jgi:hypothetical protein
VDVKGLDYRGSFSRGFSVGNSQSLVLNSNFDMQLKGDLGGGMQIVAAISDENLPIQAAGNTQQLQEFDKIFIRVSKGKSGITAGDYELSSPKGYFMKYYKKLEGLSAYTSHETSPNTTLTTRGSVAVSRGKFARRFITISEGNQGPYRLSGNFNERFIIVLSGTEKVFFNGVLLKRGYDLDYTIDYNRAEITFSPTRPVARDSRVIVEFEYTDISYLRTLYAAETDFQGQNWSAGFNLYSEQDSRQGTGAVLLDSTDVAILKSSGDDIQSAVRNSFRALTSDEKQANTGILYGGKPNPLRPGELILYYTESADSAIYLANFTEVGQGKGDYAIDGSRAKNGRVYRYMGQGQGTHLPLRQLVPPEQKQLLTAYLNASPSRGLDVQGEVAVSQYDFNRLSDLGNDDNVGSAANFGIRQEVEFDTSGQSSWYGSLRFEGVGRQFTPLNPYRSAEFARDWNIGVIQQRQREQWWQMATGFHLGERVRGEYGIQYFERKNLFYGTKQNGELSLASHRWQLRAVSQFLTSYSPFLAQTTHFVRPNIRATYYILADKSIQANVEWDAESNRVRGTLRDTMARKSNAFDLLKWTVGTDFEKNLAFRGGFSVRRDAFGKANILAPASTAYEWELAGKWATGGSDLQWSFISRDLRIQDASLLPNDKSKRTLLGKADHTLQLKNQLIRMVNSYNTTSGQEPKYEYVFQKVETGQGEYIYIGDTTAAYKVNVQDFRYDPTHPLASYIRLSLPNNEFVRTTNTELNHSATVDFSRLWKQEVRRTSLQDIFGRFSFLSNARLVSKYRDGKIAGFQTLFQLPAEDTSLVSHLGHHSQTLFFNKGHASFDLQLGQKSSSSRILLIAGIEQRVQLEQFFRLRWAIFPTADLILLWEQGRKKLDLSLQPGRNLDLVFSRIRPELNFRPNPRMRVIARCIYQLKRQQILTLDKANILDGGMEFTYRQAGETSIDVGASIVHIRFTGAANSFIEYDLLEGLKNGKNYLWQTTLTKRVTKNMDLTFRYEGRKSGFLPVVHVGRVQLKATF